MRRMKRQSLAYGSALTKVGCVPPRGRRSEQIARRHVDAVDEVQPAGERATRGERLGLESIRIPSVNQ